MNGTAERGRPSIYAPELAEKILYRMSQGESLRAICRDEGMPNECTVRTWALNDREGFFSHYEKARALQAHAVADKSYQDALEAKDAGLGRLAFDAGKWFAGKLLPKVYGDKVLNENQQLGKDGQPVDPSPLVVRFVNAKDGRPE